MPKKVVESLILGILLVVAVFLYTSTAAYPQAVQGSTAAYVRFLAVCMGGLCALELLFCLRRKNTSSSEQVQDAKESFSLVAKPKPFWALLFLLVMYAGLFSYTGFYIASALFLPVTMFVLGARKPVTIALTTLGVLGFVYAVFERLLEVYMPVGSFFE